MARFEFTDRWLKSLALGERRVFWDSVLPRPGLFGLRVGRSTMTWWIVYRVGGVGPTGRKKLGRYPDVSLADARKQARADLILAETGVDPAADRREKRASARRTVRAMFEAYESHVDERRKAGEFRSWADVKRSIERDVLPELGADPVKDIRRSDIVRLVTAKAQIGKAAANRLQAHLSMLFAYGVEHDWVTGNPVAGLRKRTEQPRSRVLTDGELQALWAYLTGPAPIELARGKGTARRVMAPGTDATLKDLFRMLTWTGQRIAETSKAKWSDVDLDAARWTIPASDTKNGREHRVPLVLEVAAMLQARRDAAPADHVYVFPSTSAGTGSAHVWSKRTAAAIAEAINVRFTAHDLRRTLATRLGDMGIPGDTIDAILNHSRPGVLRHYDHSTRERLKRDALARWAAELQRIVTETPTKVIPMAAGGAR